MNRISSNGRTRVLCVDDHGLLAEGLKVRLGDETDLEVVGCLPDGRRLLEETERLEPDVILMDLEMPGPDPFELAAEVRRLHPQSRVVILTAHVRDHYLSAAFKAGVWGYIS
ncbi:MAG: response regulator, partial [Phycisphaerales bacterium]